MNLPLIHSSTLADPLTCSFAASYTGVVAFLAVATEGNFARAADRLGVGRSAVSRSVQRLEEHLGARLFSRTTRSTSLTSEGELFLESCRPGVERIQQALEEIRDLRHGPPRGQLRISAPHAFGRLVIAPLLEEFRLLHPGVAVELLLEARPPDLAVDRIDVVFRDGRLDDSQVIAKQLILMPTVVCASVDYARRHGLPIDLEALPAHACINRRLWNGRLRPWEFRVQGQAQNAVPPGDEIFNDDELLLQAVLAGRGVGQFPAFQVCSLLRTGRLLACLGQFAPDDRSHYLCYLSRRQLPKRIRAFIDFITPQVRALDMGSIEGPKESHADLRRLPASVEA
jgi:DNA-binding transcriptional LysR family regulator